MVIPVYWITKSRQENKNKLGEAFWCGGNKAFNWEKQYTQFEQTVRMAFISQYIFGNWQLLN